MDFYGAGATPRSRFFRGLERGGLMSEVFSLREGVSLMQESIVDVTLMELAKFVCHLCFVIRIDNTQHSKNRIELSITIV